MDKNIIKFGKKGHRKLGIGDYDVENRIVRFSASSEEMVDRGTYIEVLSHDPSNVDLTRIDNGICPLLMDHDWTEQVGRIMSYEFSDSKLYMTAKISRNEDGCELLNDLQDDIRNGISIGYNLENVISQSIDKESNKPIYVFSWSIHEVSSVSVPADTNVGFGRSLEQEEFIELEVKASESVVVDEVASEVVQDEVVDVVLNTNEVVVDNLVNTDDKLNSSERNSNITVKENIKMDMELIALVAQHGEKAQRAMSLIEASKGELNAANLSEAIRALSPAQPVKSGIEGIQERDAARVNIGKLLMCQQEGKHTGSIEADIVRNAAFRSGTAGGFALPVEVESAKNKQILRSLQTTTSAAKTLDQEVLSTLDLLKALSVFGDSANYVSNNGNGYGSVVVPRVLTATGTDFVAEGSDVPDFNMTFENLSLTPKTVGSVAKISRQLMNSNIEIQDLAYRHMILDMIYKVDREAFAGSAFTNDITQHAGTQLTSAGAVSYAEIVDFVGKMVNDKKVDPAMLKFAVNPRLYAKFKAALKHAGVAGDLMVNGAIDGNPVIQSHQIAVTAGTPDVTKLFAFDATYASICQWSGVEFKILDTDNSGVMRVRGMWDVDFGLINPDAFGTLSGIQL